MRRFEFILALSADEIRRLYAGSARFLIVEDLRGIRLQLPLGNFRRFVGHDGIQGRFEVRIDDDNRIIELRKIRGAQQGGSEI